MTLVATDYGRLLEPLTPFALQVVGRVREEREAKAREEREVLPTLTPKTKTQTINLNPKTLTALKPYILEPYTLNLETLHPKP
jgi:hypothetical protein